VLALSWSVAQLGWVGGPVAMLCFAFVTYLSALLLSHCYRSPVSDGDDPQKRQRNYTYMDAVRTHLGTLRYLKSFLALRPCVFVLVLVTPVVFVLSSVCNTVCAFAHCYLSMATDEQRVQGRSAPGSAACYSTSTCTGRQSPTPSPRQHASGTYPDPFPLLDLLDMFSTWQPGQPCTVMLC